MKRIDTKQKDINQMKKRFQSKITEHGGSTSDERRRGGCVMTTYTRHSACRRFKWHGSYGDRRTTRNIRRKLRTIAKVLGVDEIQDI